MCKFKSAIIMKDRVFIPDYNSHSKMLEELKIEDTRANAERFFVRAELYPKDEDVFSDIDSWVFNVDQDIRPEWFVKEVDKERMITAVKEWAKTHIYIGVDNLIIESGQGYCIKDCKNVEIVNATVNEVYGNATVKWVYGNATVNEVYGNATVNEVYGNATVNEVCENATVNEVCGNATVNKVCENATVKWVYGNATVNEVCENATVNKVCENATVKRVYENATVNEVCGNATVNKVYGNATVNEGKGYAVIVGSSYGWKNGSNLILSENATFKDCEAKVIYQSGGWELRSV